MDPQEAKIFTAVVITSVILGSVILYFFISIIRQQRRNIALHKSKILAEITTLENERKRTAADLHDELGPILSAVKFQINSFELHDKDDQENLEKANKNIDTIISRMRGIANDLMPNTLLRKGLVPAMKASIESINKSNRLEIDFSATDIPDLPETTAINLYRILQEVIHNTIKHAVATQLKIELKKKNNFLIVFAVDNGVGFDYSGKSKEQAGLGLRNLLSRTEILGGSMYVDSKADKGTRFTFEIPLT
ncbi:MAG TPA: ATP-binding protein [Chitinophagaceae bacterium]|nr:ATP-binding protein [Chitinophagaceae bacterium]